MSKARLDPEVARLTMITCLCFNLRRADRAVTRTYDDALRPSGVLATQLPILMALRRFQPIGVSALADDLAMDRTTLTRNLRPLRRDGLVELQPGPSARTRQVSLTRKGERTAISARALWKRVQDRVVRRLGTRRVPELVAALGTIVDTMNAARN